MASTTPPVLGSFADEDEMFARTRLALAPPDETRGGDAEEEGVLDRCICF